MFWSRATNAVVTPNAAISCIAAWLPRHIDFAVRTDKSLDARSRPSSSAISAASCAVTQSCCALSATLRY